MGLFISKGTFFRSQLAEALNQLPSVITKWLRGTHNFTSDTLSNIENILGIKLLAVEEKREQQVVSYRTQISAAVVNEPDKG